MALDDVVNEIRGRQKMAPMTEDEPAPKRGRPKKEMTKAEIEAYRQKMMEREEARYLKASGRSDDAPKKRRKRKANAEMDSSPKSEKTVAAEQRQTEPQKVSRKPRQPKMLQPLEPLYLLKIPGLPKGDCISICLVHGAEDA